MCAAGNVFGVCGGALLRWLVAVAVVGVSLRRVPQRPLISFCVLCEYAGICVVVMFPADHFDSSRCRFTIT